MIVVHLLEALKERWSLLVSLEEVSSVVEESRTIRVDIGQVVKSGVDSLRWVAKEEVSSKKSGESDGE